MANKVTGLSTDDLNTMFNVTDEKREKMKSFEGKRMLTMPSPADKKGIVVRLLWSKDANGNPVFAKTIESEHLPFGGKMNVITVEEQGDEGEECEIAYSKSLHYSLTKLADTRGIKLEDLIGKWIKINSEEYESNKAPSGKAIAYRATYREDLNSVVGNAPVSSQF